MMLTRESNAQNQGKIFIVFLKWNIQFLIEMKEKNFYLSNKDMNFIVKGNRKYFKRNEHFLHSKIE